MAFPIDAVIPFVDCSDPLWLEDFHRAGLRFGEDFRTHECRWRDTGTFRLVIRSLRLFAPYIRDIYVIVSRESQIPSWLDKDVKIIFHRDFVPAEFLPLFSASAFETWMGLLPVGEHFIYFNDDMILTSPTTPETFFTADGIPRIGVAFRRWDGPRDIYRCASYNIVHGAHQMEMVVAPQHGPAPYRLSWCREFVDMHREELRMLTHPLCRTGEAELLAGAGDICQYAYMCHQAVNHGIDNRKIPGRCFAHRYEDFDVRKFPQWKWISLNDMDNIDIDPFVRMTSEYLSLYEL